MPSAARAVGRRLENQVELNIFHDPYMQQYYCISSAAILRHIIINSKADLAEAQAKGDFVRILPVQRARTVRPLRAHITGCCAEVERLLPDAKQPF